MAQTSVLKESEPPVEGILRQHQFAVGLGAMSDKELGEDHTDCTSMDAEQYLPLLKRVLTPERLRHSIGVMRVMEELAGIYPLDRTRARITGLLHDAAKDLDRRKQLTLVREAGIQLQDPCDRLPVYLHAPASACLVSKEWGISDRLLLDAISMHTYCGDGPDFDAPLSRCLRAADILAPTHQWNGMQRLRSEVYSGHLEEAGLLQLRWLIEYLEELGLPVHPDLRARCLDAVEELSPPDDFFTRW